MSYCQGEYIIKNKKNLAKNCYDITVFCPDMAEQAQAGQFVHIRIKGFSLRRPISICQIDRKNGLLRLVFEVRGAGTQAMADWNTGDMIDLIGPLGHGFTLLDPDKKAIVVGGGIGTPPMLEVADHYKQNATAIIGFRSAEAVILAEDFENVSPTVICTDDGTKGTHGYVTTALEKVLKAQSADIIYACGPHPMLKGIAALAEKYHISCEVSLEERMGCGVGACLVCACKTVKNSKEYMAHVCKDGPVFNAKEVIL